MNYKSSEETEMSEPRAELLVRITSSEYYLWSGYRARNSCVSFISKVRLQKEFSSDEELEREDQCIQVN